jgi:AcrR family transcriptional regulator
MQPLDLAIARACEAVSHNLNGQRLGRKGRETRERLLVAAIEVLNGEEVDAFTLSAVARRAGLGMSSVYNYFTDLSELMAAVLEPVMASAEEAYLGMFDDCWPDAELVARCEQFWVAYAQFWDDHAAILHQRNRMSDSGDARMLDGRVSAGGPLMQGISRQLRGSAELEPLLSEQAMASVLATMMERTVTVQSSPAYREYTGESQASLGASGARLLALAMRDARNARRLQAVSNETASG